eukprot:COSAG01_NODE_37451_length_503_cov_1.029703_1_plen_81_part_01
MTDRGRYQKILQPVVLGIQHRGHLLLVQVRSEAEAQAARHTERAVEALRLQALGAEQRVTAAEAEARARQQVSEERTQALE